MPDGALGSVPCLLPCQHMGGDLHAGLPPAPDAGRSSPAKRNDTSEDVAMALTEVCRTQRPRSTNRLRYSLVISRSRGQRRRWRAPVSDACWALLGANFRRSWCDLEPRVVEPKREVTAPHNRSTVPPKLETFQGGAPMSETTIAPIAGARLRRRVKGRVRGSISPMTRRIEKSRRQSLPLRSKARFRRKGLEQNGRPVLF
jgi:hypothetical protein